MQTPGGIPLHYRLSLLISALLINSRVHSLGIHQLGYIFIAAKWTTVIAMKPLFGQIISFPQLAHKTVSINISCNRILYCHHHSLKGTTEQVVELDIPLFIDQCDMFTWLSQVSHHMAGSSLTFWTLPVPLPHCPLPPFLSNRSISPRWWCWFKACDNYWSVSWKILLF